MTSGRFFPCAAALRRPSLVNCRGIDDAAAGPNKVEDFDERESVFDANLEPPLEEGLDLSEIWPSMDDSNDVGRYQCPRSLR